MACDFDVFDPISYGWVFDFFYKRKEEEAKKKIGEDVPVSPV